MFNKPYTYNQNVTLVAGAQLLYQHKMLEDFYCFDIAGVDSVATGQNLRMRIRDVTEQREFMPERMRSGLIAAIVSGDSSWFFPTLFKKGHVIEVECALDAGAPAVNFDIGLIGYHHEGGTPAYCEPPKKIRWYSWEFNSIAAFTVETVTQRILSDQDFVGVGWVSTDVCTTVNTLTFRIKNETLGYYWSNERIMGSTIFPGIIATVRRNRFRIPLELRGGDLITIEAENTTGGGVDAVAIGMYGYQDLRGRYADR